MITDAGELRNFQEAHVHEHKNKWKKSMQEEIESSHKNETWFDEIAKGSEIF